MKATPLTAEQLAKEVNLPSAGSVKNLARRGVIPVLKYGYRTPRYDLEKCRQALERFEVRAVR